MTLKACGETLANVYFTMYIELLVNKAKCGGELYLMA